MPEELGPFLVRAERTRIEAYQRSLGASASGVPATFPICWLGQADIRAAVAKACGPRLPLHESQTFDYVAPLEVGREYRLSLILSEEPDPPRLVLKGEVATASGEPCLRMETLLRLVASAAMELSA